MRPSRLAAVLAVALAACGTPDRAAPAVAPAEVPESAVRPSGLDRPARIAANLALELPGLRDRDIEVTDLAPSDLPGLDEGTVAVGDRTFRFLVSADDTQLFVLAAGPLDASRSATEVADALKDQAAAAQWEGPLFADLLAEETRGLPSRGPAGAPVTVVTFADFQCPYCRRLAATLDSLRARYPDSVRVVHAHFPLDQHDWARPAAIAATCAADQDVAAFWTLHDLYFADPEALTPETIVATSRDALAGSGLDLRRWESCAGDARSVAHQTAARGVEAQARLGRRYGVTGTPGSFVNGESVRGSQPLVVFEAAVDDALGIRDVGVGSE